MLLSILFLSSFPYAADTNKNCGHDAVSVSVDLGGIPDFIFIGEQAQLMVDVASRQNRPRLDPGRKSKAIEIEVHIKGPGILRPTSRTAILPQYSDQAASVPFGLNAAKLEHGSKLEVVILSRNNGKNTTLASKTVVALQPNLTNTDIFVRFDHFEDKSGRRIMFLVPRVDQERKRRWYAVTSLTQKPGSRHQNLLIGARYGNAAYARHMADLCKSKNEHFLPPALADIGDGLPIHRLLAAAIRQRNTMADTIFVFPGVSDIRTGTSLAEYRMALHAILSVLDQNNLPSTRFILATPPPYPAAPERAHAYCKAALAVARERGWHTANLEHVFSWSPASEQGSPVIKLYPDSRQQKLVARCMIGTARTNLKAWSMLIGSCSLFFLASCSLLWLTLRARAKTTGA